MGMTKSATNTTVYISNLSYKRDRNGLRALFTKFGKIKEINIIVEPRTGQPRGMAFVEMSSVEEAQAAIKGLNGQVIDGRTAKAKWATPLKDENRPKFFMPKVDAKTGKPAKKVAKKTSKDLDYKERQLAKKAKNDAKRKSNPLQFKVAKKKTTPKS